MHSMYRNLKCLTTFFLSNSKYAHSVVSYVSKSSSNEQIDILKSALGNDVKDWFVLKSNILSKQGSVNEKNVDAVILKTMVRNKKLELALNFVNHLTECNSSLNIGVTNGILSLYHELGKQKPLLDIQKQFILSTYKDLYDKYNVLEYSTAETLLHALCAIDEWQKALKTLKDIQVSCTPSHSAYSTLIGTLFRNNKERDALLIIDRSVSDSRPLQFVAYKEWIAYFLRKYKNKATILKHLDKINEHISTNCAIISEETAEHLKNTYVSLGWNATFSEIQKNSGQCKSCSYSLKNFKLSNEEFELLQRSVKDKIIVGSDLFLKTSPKELSSFLKFVEKTAPYDVVLDALNIAYVMGRGSNIEKMGFLKTVVDHFSGKNKKILLVGRKHMLKWHKRNLAYIMAKTCNFFTDDLSQDDPFFITAAILSGPNTDIVSKDLFRGHRFSLHDKMLKQIFQRWQWQHQWMVFLKAKRPIIQPPLQFTPCAQKDSDGWHLPYQKEQVSGEEKLFEHDGIPDYDSWLCFRSKVNISAPDLMLDQLNYSYLPVPLKITLCHILAFWGSLCCQTTNNNNNNSNQQHQNINDFSRKCDVHNINNRNKKKFVLPKTRLQRVSNSFYGQSIRFYSRIPENGQKAK